MEKKLVILTGAGMSAESGISTFRDSNGLWENHDIMEVATPEGFERNPDLVYRFYNQRRKQLHEVIPNEGHLLLKEFEDNYEVTIVTQNVDDLHERAGSTNVLHLHGELRKVRSITNEHEVYDWDGDLTAADKDRQGNPLRPHIVWFGEAVPNIEKAAEIVSKADVIVIIGTSLQVYPAAGLIDYCEPSTPIYYIDPNPTSTNSNVTQIKENAIIGIKTLKTILNS